MPTISITHEPWCFELLGPDVGLDETCTTKQIYFGPPMPTHPGETSDEYDTRGSLHVQLSEEELEPVAIITWAPREHGQVTLGALKALGIALSDDPTATLGAINEALAQMETVVSA